MRVRPLLGLLAASVVLIGLGTAGVTAAQAAAPGIDPPRCANGGGTVEYEPYTGASYCSGGTYDGQVVI